MIGWLCCHVNRLASAAPGGSAEDETLISVLCYSSIVWTRRRQQPLCRVTTWL